MTSWGWYPCCSNSESHHAGQRGVRGVRWRDARQRGERHDVARTHERRDEPGHDVRREMVDDAGADNEVEAAIEHER